MIEGGRATGVVTDQGNIKADKVVLATGTQVQKMLSSVDVNLPMENALGLLMRTQPVKRFSDRIFCSSSVHFWQLDDGAILAGEDFGGSQISGEENAIMNKLCKELENYLPDLGPFTAKSFRITMRPIPKGGMPVCSDIPSMENLFVASLHSGITLAPIMGRAITDMITTGTCSDLLKPYHISRF